jgi:hypothetical protein
MQGRGKREEGRGKRRRAKALGSEWRVEKARCETCGRNWGSLSEGMALGWSYLTDLDIGFSREAVELSLLGVPITGDGGVMIRNRVGVFRRCAVRESGLHSLSGRA